MAHGRLGARRAVKETSGTRPLGAEVGASRLAIRAVAPVSLAGGAIGRRHAGEDSAPTVSARAFLPFKGGQGTLGACPASSGPRGDH